MRRASMLAAVVAVLLVAFAGVASAAVIACTGGRCEGTPQADGITGTDLRDRIFAFNGFDEVLAGAGRDELNGGNLGDRLGGEDGSDTYFGGSGADELSEFAGDFEEEDSGNDEMNGGDGPDFMESGEGDDILGAGRATREAMPETWGTSRCSVTLVTTSSTAVRATTAWQEKRVATSIMAAQTTTSSTQPFSSRWILRIWSTVATATTSA